MPALIATSMPLADLLRRELTTRPTVLLLLAALAGISNALVMAIINTAAGAAGAGRDARGIAMFGLTVGLYAVSQRRLMRLTAQEVETVVHRLRTTIIAKIGRADLLPLERVGRSDILGAMIRDTQTISQAASFLVIGLQSAILIVMAMGYVWTINGTAFALCLGFIVAAAVFVLRRLGALRAQTHAASAREHVVYDGLRDVLDGFKEVKMSAARRDALMGDIAAVSQGATDLKIATQGRSATEFVIGQALVMLLLGLIVFVLPAFAPIDRDAVVRTTTAVLFIIGPLGMVVQAVPLLGSANAAAEHLLNLDRLMDGLDGAPTPPLPADRPADLSGAIVLEDVAFAYREAGAGAPFAVGPIFLTVQPGEVLFVTGGNGSGKSTLIKLLLGLYRPDRGVIRVGETVLTPALAEAYRARFSAIFSDYHLFRRLYGIDPPGAAEFEGLCALLELTGKVRLQGEHGDAFDRLDLSSGQRKRLALLVALIEDRPILVFDEWAADQDPHFRRRFYQELIPALRARGKTVIAVTHDDRYFAACDRHVVLEDGRIASVGRPRVRRPRAR